MHIQKTKTHTQANLYTGNNRSMLVSNCLFRAGGAAMVMSNRRVCVVCVCVCAHVTWQSMSCAMHTPATPPPTTLHSPDDAAKANYEILHSVRTDIGANDEAFNAIRQREARACVCDCCGCGGRRLV